MVNSSDSLLSKMTEISPDIPRNFIYAIIDLPGKWWYNISETT